MPRLEVQSFLDFAPHYFNYITNAVQQKVETQTLICKFTGLFHILRVLMAVFSVVICEQNMTRSLLCYWGVVECRDFKLFFLHIYREITHLSWSSEPPVSMKESHRFFFHLWVYCLLLEELCHNKICEFEKLRTITPWENVKDLIILLALLLYFIDSKVWVCFKVLWLIILIENHVWVIHE